MPDIQLIYVKYYDHAGSNGGGWVQTSEINFAPLVIETIGWVIYEDEIQLVVSHTRCWREPDTTCQRTYVIKSCILEREEVKLYA